MPKKIFKAGVYLIFLMLFSVMTYTGYSVIRNIDSKAQAGSSPTLISYPGDTFSAGAQGGSAWSNIAGDAYISGRIGIKDTTPDYALDIGENAQTDVNVYGSGTSGTLGGYKIRDVYRLANQTGTFEDTYLLAGAAGVGNIIFGNITSAGTTTGNITERMRINSNGNVGIGTNNPTYRFQVSNDMNGSANNANCSFTCYWNHNATMTTNLTGTNNNWAGATTLSLSGTNSMGATSAWSYIAPLKVWAETINGNSEAYAIEVDLKTNNSSAWARGIDIQDDPNSTAGHMYGISINLDDGDVSDKWGISQISNNPNYFAGSVRAGASNSTACAILVSDDACLKDLQNGALNVMRYDGGAGTNWGTVNAGSWGTMSSREIKKDITELDQDKLDSMLDLVKNLKIYNYRYNWEDNQRILHTGVIAEESPWEILSEDKKAVSLYDYSSYALGAIKALNSKAEKLEDENSKLRSDIEDLRNELEQIKQEIKN